MQMVQLILRIVEWIWTILIMGLSGNIIAIKNGHATGVINYTMFTSVFSMLTLFYLTLVAYNEDLAGMALIPIVLDALNIIFTLTCGIALAAKLGVHSCSNGAYTSTNSVIAGSGSLARVCHEAQASDAFLWFLFACFVASLVFSVMGGQGSGASLRPSRIRKGGPSMSQV